jgi:hypothetical protein
VEQPNSPLIHQELLEQYGPTCQLCGDLIDQTIPEEYPRSLSMIT